MSGWDSYIDNIIGYSKGNADKAAIIGQDGSVWTTAHGGKGISVQAQEAATLAKCIKNTDFSELQAKGLFLEGVKYQFLREEDGKIVQAKKKDHGAISCSASKTAIVIVHTAEGKQAGDSTTGAVQISDYLESLGY